MTADISTWEPVLVGDCLQQLSLTGIEKVQTRDYKEHGAFPVVDQGASEIAGWTDNYCAVIRDHLPVIVFGDHTRALKYMDSPFARGADGTQILKPKAGINELFFYYACRAINIGSKGYARHFADLKESTIKLPSERTQQFIARALLTMEQSLNASERVEKRIARLKTTVMRELFEHGLHSKRQKDTEIGPIPENWELRRTEEVLRLSSGATRPAKLATERSKQNPYPVLGGNGVMGYSHVFNTRNESSLVIGRVGAYCGAVHLVRGPAWITDNALYSREWISKDLSLDFVSSFFRYYGLNRLKREGAQPLITQGGVYEVTIPVPDMHEQESIVEILASIEDALGLKLRKIALLQVLFQVLLNGFMNGDIDASAIDLSVLE